MYLEKRHRIWHALHSIPLKAREALGKDRFCKSLGTDSKREAHRRAATLEPEWRRRINEVLSDNPDQLQRDYGHWRRSIMHAESDEDRELAVHLLGDELIDKVYHAARRAGVSMEDKDAVQDLPEYAEARDAYLYATGQKVSTTKQLDAYLSSLEGNRKKKTIDMRRGTLTRLGERMPYLDDITGDNVQRYINDRMANGASVSTIDRERGEWRDYWRYLRSLKLVDRDRAPFEDLYLPRVSTKRQNRWIGFTPAESVKLLRVAEEKRNDKNLADLIRLCMFTGARIGELAHLTVDDIDDGFLIIRDSKTVAGIRDVPIHPRLEPVVERLKNDTKDGYLLTREKPDEYGDRSTNISKRFGHLKRKLGHGRRYVFHSLRRTVTTGLVNAGVLEAQADDITGHATPGMTYGYYSDGSSRATTAAAIAKLDYPELADDDMV